MVKYFDEKIDEFIQSFYLSNSEKEDEAKLFLLYLCGLLGEPVDRKRIYEIKSSMLLCLAA